MIRIWAKIFTMIIFFFASLVFLPLYLFFVSCTVFLYVLHHIEKELSEIKKSA